jgi:hypothetical protein
MSFFDDLKKMATDFLASPQGQGAVAAASEHITQMDPQQLAGHLQDSLGSMDAEKVTALGQQLLQTFTSHQAYQGDGAQAAQAAGTTAEAVTSGAPAAVSSLIAYAQAHPEILQAATTAFMQRNPSALQQLAPGLLSGLMAKLGINPEQAQPPS